MEQYSRPKRGGIRAINLDDGDRLIGVSLVTKGDQIVLATSNGFAIRFDEDDARAMGRAAGGVRGISLREGDKVVDLVVGRPGCQLLAACENGFGKRTPIDEYRHTNRGGMGVINIKVNERNGKVVNVVVVDDTTELLLLTERGMVQRIGAAGIRETGRAAQGVRLMALEEGDRLTTMAKIPHIEEQAAGGAPAHDGVPSSTAAPTRPAPPRRTGAPARRPGRRRRPRTTM